MSAIDADDAERRESLLASLSRRLEAFLRDGDERGVVGEDAAAEARTLLDLVWNSPGDPQVQMTVAHLHWSRFEVARRSNRPADSERRSALAHFSAVYDEHSKWIPAEARMALDRVQDSKSRASNLIDEAATECGTRSLDRAIVLIRDIVAELGVEDPTLPVPLSELAVALNARYMVGGRTSDIDEAVEAIDRAVALTHPVDPEERRRRQLRKWILVTRYDDRRDEADLVEAIEVGHTLFDSAAPDDPDRALMLLDFASLYWRRYQRTQAIADLDSGIRYGRQGLEQLGDGNPPQAASSEDDLAVLLRHRGSRTGSTPDLLEAVRFSRQAVAGFPSDHFDWIGICSGLGESLRRAGRDTRDVDMLREAVRVSEDIAGRSVERRHPAVAGFRENDDPALLDEAIAHHTEAVGGSHDNPATAQLRINLAAAFRSRYERDRDRDDRARAIELFRAIAAQEPISTRLRLIGASVACRKSVYGQQCGTMRSCRLLRRWSCVRVIVPGWRL